MKMFNYVMEYVKENPDGEAPLSVGAWVVTIILIVACINMAYS